MSQLKLLPDRRFWPLFWTQFLGAFNDNLFKNALVMLVTFKAMTLGTLNSQQVVAMAAGVFILPFFLFSATAGQISDRISKARLIRIVKFAEIVIMGLAALGFILSSLPLLMSVLFFMGLQSAFFGPAKYSILPELVEEDELVGGNALVETGTFLAILLGTIGAGLLIGMGERGLHFVAAGVVAVAALGYLTSRFVNQTPPGAPDLKVSLNPITPTLETWRAARGNRSVYLSIVGISWFWFLGSAFLSLLPIYTRDVLHGNEQMVTLFLSLFCIGIALGSMLCEKMSAQRLELGLVPFGSIGMSVFALDIFFAGNPWEGLVTPEGLLGIGSFLDIPGAVRVCADLFFLAIFSGFYTVPLYTLIQQRSEDSQRSRVIAANNILNAFFMVLSALALMGLLGAGFSIPQVFLALAALNLAAAAYIYTVIPEFLLRFVLWIVANSIYRLRVRGRANIPMEGPVVLVANHVSFADWMLIAAACKRPPRFVMDHSFLKLPLVGFIFRDAHVIPIAPARESAEIMEQAFDLIAAELEDDQVVCIFPEGKITKDGEMSVFRPGIERILKRNPVPVVPIAIEGMWGSFFSRKSGKALTTPFRRFWSRVKLTIGEPVPAASATARNLAEKVAELGGFEVSPDQA